jgi:uncharacterized protein YndB with AHSA1/START domain
VNLRLVLRRALWTALTLGVIAAVGVALLFSGSTVTCVEEAPATGPALRCAFEVAAPRERVWAAFATVDQPRPYYFDAVLQGELRPGGRWRFVTDDLSRLLAEGEILAFEPPRHFAQTFAAADLDEPPSRIAVELEAVPGGSKPVSCRGGRVSTPRSSSRR